jgi:hypothetical protein
MYGLSPKILLATAEKENSLVKRSKIPSAATLNFAMGCGQTSDFLSQLNCSANTFVYQFGQTPFEPFFLKESDFHIRHYVTGMGRQPVGFQVKDAATYAQYRYTPFIQTSATGGGVYLFESLCPKGNAMFTSLSTGSGILSTAGEKEPYPDYHSRPIW